MSRRLARAYLSLLVTRVDDLDPPIFAGERACRILQLGLAVADRHQVARVDSIFLREEPLDRLGAALGEPLVVGVGALGIGMAGNNEGAALQFGARQSLAESGDLRTCLRTDVVRIVIEVH